ncbi:hypothetical protein L484_005859 [Morus notabilis]|uniref:FLZ-type domain-containing protein n=1 Tax=Morus notabilis TaxID=981085 RepID=W9RTB1_9ROSA|nr:hypothetical protein L484_005859 [Morus notabilis]
MNKDAIADTRRPCFSEEDDGLASLADMEAGFSGSHHHDQSHALYSRPLYYSRRSSFRSLPMTLFSSFSSSTSLFSSRSGSARFYDAWFEEHQPHFLVACFLCKKSLADNKDIFMYRLVFSPSFVLFMFDFEFLGRKELERGIEMLSGDGEGHERYLQALYLGLIVSSL